MRCLIADDDAISRLLMSKILGRHGVCVTAEDGVEAVARFAAALDGGDPFDLVCLDVSMPNMDGQEALAKIREMEEHRRVPPEKTVKIVMATIHDDGENLRQAARGRCDGYLVKPVTPQAVGEILVDLGLIRG